MGLVNSGEYSVRFGSTVSAEVVAGTYGSSTTLSFISPSTSTAQGRNVYVAVNGQQYVQVVDTSDDFTFYSITLSGLSPNSGPTTGETDVVISGTDFVTTSDTIQVKVDHQSGEWVPREIQK